MKSGKVTLQDVYRAQIEQDRLITEIDNLEDSRQPLMAQFKGALGMTREQPDPPAPTRFESTALDLDGGELLDDRLRAQSAPQSDGSGRAPGGGLARPRLQIQSARFFCRFHG